MKINFQLLFFSVISCTVLNAQNIHYEGFDYPNDFGDYTLDTLPYNTFLVFPYANGQAAPVPNRNFYGSVGFDWNIPQFEESTFDDWLITPQVTPQSNTNLQFLSTSLGDISGSYPSNSAMYEIRLSTTDTLRTSFTVLLESYTFGGSEVVEPIIDLSAYDGIPVYIAFINLSTNIIGLAWDNIEIGTLDGTDAGLTIGELDPAYLDGSITLPYRLHNKYGDNIVSFDLNYQVDGGAITTESFSGYSVTLFDSIDVAFTAGTVINTGGLHEVKMWVDNLNGGGVELYLPNDTLISNVNVSSLSIEELDAPISDIFPNPSEGSFTIQSKEALSKVEIINLSGKVVYQEEGLKDNKKSFNFETLNNGTYVVFIQYQYGAFEKRKIQILR